MRIIEINLASLIRPIVIGLFALSMIAPAFAQDPAKLTKPDTKQAEPNRDQPGKRPFTLTVKTKPIVSVSLKAEKSSLAEIAEQLSKRLNIPVAVSPALIIQPLSIDFAELTLEPAMQLLAPEVYIDYQIDTGAGTPPRPLGIFLYTESQNEPPVTAVVPSSSQSLLIEGDTEEGVEPRTDEEKKKQEEQPLRVHFENNYLSVKAKRQPLTLVLLKIGDELGIPVDIKGESDEIVDTEFSKVPVEDAMRLLSPHIQLFLRANLTRAERRALRLVLSEPAKMSERFQ
ncbi:MAG: hypothetical protein ABR555_20035 [Pyrinomonadaceae bacterium]